MSLRKLTDAEIAAIRASDLTNVALAADYGVSPSTIQRHRPQRGKGEPRSLSKDSYLVRIENDELRRQAEIAVARSARLRNRALEAQRRALTDHEQQFQRAFLDADLLTESEREAIRQRIHLANQRWSPLGAARGAFDTRYF